MQIIKLEISKYKCLKNFSIDFTTDYEKGYSNTVLIGENGSGKSSIIEAITMILMSYDSLAVARQIDFSYVLEYIYAGRFFKLAYDYETEIYRVAVEENGNIIFNRPHKSTISLRRILQRYNIRLFPANIITYYSGSDERLDRLNKQRESHYTKRIHEYIESNTSFQAIGQEEEPFPHKKYWYYTKELSAPILLALLLSDQGAGESIKEKLKITGIESFQIEIESKSTLRYTGEEITKIPSENSDYLFEVLDSLNDHITRKLARSKNIVTSNSIIIRVEDFSEWFMNSYTILDFFDKLSLIFKVNYRLRVFVGGTSIDLCDLSEGQRQLVNALGLLTVCKNQDCLVLMDEPDVYLNPRWKYEYLEYLKESILGAINTQILISTHDPLMINGLEKEYIRKLELKRARQGYKTVVYYPVEDTSGLGIDGLLQSEYYGLSYTVDAQTQKKVNQKRDLMVKQKQGELTSEEERRLIALTTELENLTFARNIPTDNYYDEYVAAMHKIYADRPQVALTSEEIKERNLQAEKILRELLKK